MGERLREEIKVQKWVIVLLLPLLLTLTSFTINLATSGQNIKDRVEVVERDILECQKDLKEELDKKADAEDIDRIYDILFRIENKLDTEIAKDSK